VEGDDLSHVYVGEGVAHDDDEEGLVEALADPLASPAVPLSSS
jgi:hypothetical protein